jgi:glucan phosphoethanolaminetransferase (alkaline phosphatase superfamily)
VVGLLCLVLVVVAVVVIVRRRRRQQHVALDVPSTATTASTVAMPLEVIYNNDDKNNTNNTNNNSSYVKPPGSDTNVYDDQQLEYNNNVNEHTPASSYADVGSTTSLNELRRQLKNKKIPLNITEDYEVVKKLGNAKD